MFRKLPIHPPRKVKRCIAWSERKFFITSLYRKLGLKKTPKGNNSPLPYIRIMQRRQCSNHDRTLKGSDGHCMVMNWECGKIFRESFGIYKTFLWCRIEDLKVWICALAEPIQGVPMNMGIQWRIGYRLCYELAL